MHTDEVAAIGWQLVEQKIRHEIFNVCGDEVVSMREIARLAGRPLGVASVPPAAIPRIVEASNEKIKGLFPVTKTSAALAAFFRASEKSA